MQQCSYPLAHLWHLPCDSSSRWSLPPGRATGPGSARPTRPSGARPLPSLALRPGDACRVPNSAHALAWLQVSLLTYIHQVVVRIGTGFEPVGLTCGFDRVSKPCTPRLVPAGAGVFASSIRKGSHLNEVPALVHRRTKVLFGLLLFQSRAEASSLVLATARLLPRK